MIYTLDVGNSFIKLATFDNNKLLVFEAFHEVKELSKYIINHNEEDAFYLCSVVPEKSTLLKQFIKTEYGTDTLEIKRNSSYNIKILYETPNTLGLDRICAIEGALFLSKNPENEKRFSEKSTILAIDLGTATTLNLLNYPNNFIGGIISPGVDTMFNSLGKNTAQLPVANIGDYKGIIGTSTNSSISSGIVNSTVGLIEKTIRHLNEDKKAKNIIIYVTGGGAKLIIPYLKFDFIYEKALVNYGIKNVLGRNSI